ASYTTPRLRVTSCHNRQSKIVNRNCSRALVRRADHDEPAVGAGDGAADEDEVVDRVDADHCQVADGDALVAVAPGHADAALGPTATAVGRVGANRAALAHALLDAVAGAEALVVVPLHDAGGAAALGLADDVNRLDVLEDHVGLEHLADLLLGRLVQA